MKNRLCPYFVQTFSYNTQKGIPESLNLFCCFPLLPFTVIQLLPQASKYLTELQSQGLIITTAGAGLLPSPHPPRAATPQPRAEAAGHKWWRQNSQILQNLIITLMKLLTSAFPPFRELHFVMKNEINPDCRVTARCLVSLQSSTRVAEKGCETQGVPPAEAVHKAKQPEIRNYLC